MMTPEGGKKVREQGIKRYGSAEAYAAAMREIASKGGKNSKRGGFYNNSELARKAGSIGGKASRRGPNRPKELV